MSFFDRRRFLKAAGVSLALPGLPSLVRGARKESKPRRLVCICSPLGIHGPNFFPKESGRDYELTPYLEPLAEYRSQFTVISGLSHPDVGPSHDSMSSYLTGAAHPENRAGFRNTISLDQFAAEKLRGATRHPTLTLAAEGAGLSWTRSGAAVPADFSPAHVFKKLFIEGSPAVVRAEINRLKHGRSILDMLAEQRRGLQREVSPQDAERLEQYYSSVRDLESQLSQGESWSSRPKPVVSVAPLQDVANRADILQQDKVWYDLIHLALQTDSTRLITLTLSGLTGVPLVDGVSLGYHDLSHHGQDAQKLEQLRKVELAKMKVLNGFLEKLAQTHEGEESLLDRTTLFFSSNLGNASNHDVKNLPVLVAGGGFRHGQHLTLGTTGAPPLCNLYVSFLQQLGLEVDTFASGTGRLSQLEAKT